MKYFFLSLVFVIGGTANARMSPPIPVKQQPTVPSNNIQIVKNNVLQAQNMLQVTDVIMEEVGIGGRFDITFTVMEPGKCTIYSVIPDVIVKATDGQEVHLFDRLSDDYNNLGVIRLNCDELKGGSGKYLYRCDFNVPQGPVWNQIGICLHINQPGLEKTEYTWFPLGTKPYYFITK